MVEGTKGASGDTRKRKDIDENERAISYRQEKEVSN
jgi:hypothetical protein